MAVKIRLTRIGRKKKPMYRVVVQESRTQRDGTAIDYLGSYNPLVTPKFIQIDSEKAKAWIQKGAVPSDTVARLLMTLGIIEKKIDVTPVKKESLEEVGTVKKSKKSSSTTVAKK